MRKWQKQTSTTFATQWLGYFHAGETFFFWQLFLTCGGKKASIKPAITSGCSSLDTDCCQCCLATHDCLLLQTFWGILPQFFLFTEYFQSSASSKEFYYKRLPLTSAFQQLSISEGDIFISSVSTALIPVFLIVHVKTSSIDYWPAHIYIASLRQKNSTVCKKIYEIMQNDLLT